MSVERSAGHDETYVKDSQSSRHTSSRARNQFCRSLLRKR